MGAAAADGAAFEPDSEPRNWSPEDLRVALIFASIATGYLVHASAARQQQRPPNNCNRR